MVRGFVKLAAFAGAALLTFSEMNLSAAAAGISSVLPNSGVNITLAKGTTLENLQQETGSPDAGAGSVLDRLMQLEEALDNDAQETANDDDELKNLVIAQVNNYVNIRNIPDESGEILGKLYNHAVGAFISEENGWYQISSGTVTGYVKAEYCITGEEAVELAKQICTRFATVDTETLKVRVEPSMEADVLTLVPDKEELVVTQEEPDWVKVDTEAGSGWVFREFVVLHREFVEAESREEEEARLAKEAEERLKARKAAAKASGQGKTTSQNQANVTVDGSGSEMGRAVAEYALQFVGNPYVYGGTSLTKGADCSGFVMSVYAQYGVSLPHSSSADRKQGYAVDGISNAQPGDLVCYSGHVALYIGNGQVVHAANERKGIIVSDAGYRKILAVRRIF